MRAFVASTKYCRRHEAEALNTVAQKVLVCVEEVAVNKVAAELARMDWHDMRENRGRLVPFHR